MYHKESQKRYRLKNAKKIAEKNRAYRIKNKEKCAKLVKDWHDKNPGYVSPGKMAYQATPKAKAIRTACSARHEALLKKRKHPLASDSLINEFYKESLRLSLETGIKHHVDHIIPLSVGGWHHHCNLQVMPGNLNCKKQHKVYADVGPYKTFRDVPDYLWPEHLRLLAAC